MTSQIEIESYISKQYESKFLNLAEEVNSSLHKIRELENQNEIQHKKVHSNHIFKLEYFDQKLSHISMTLSQRNEDIFIQMETLVNNKVFRETTASLKTYLENKSRILEDNQQLVQRYLTKQIATSKEELILQIESHQGMINKVQSDLQGRLHSFQNIMSIETKQEIGTFVAKAAQLEESIIQMFEKKQKVMEQMTSVQEGTTIKLNLVEGLLNSHAQALYQLDQRLSQMNLRSQINQASSIQKNSYQTNRNSYQAEQPQSAQSNIQVEFMRRQEDALSTLSHSIFNIERKLLESENKTNRQDQSFDSPQINQKKPLNFKFETDLAQVTEQNSENIPSPVKKQSSPLQKKTLILQTPPKIIEKTYPKQQNQEEKSSISKDDQLIKEQKIMNTNLEKELQNQTKYNERQQPKSPLGRSPQPGSGSTGQNRLGGLAGVRGLSRKNQNESSDGSHRRKSNASSSPKTSMSGSGLHQDITTKRSERTNTSLKSPKQKDLSALQQQNIKHQSESQKYIHKSRSQRVKEASKKQEEEEEQVKSKYIQVVYQLDEDGYLMNESGHYLLDQKGNYILLSEEQLQELRDQDLIEEES